MKIKLFREIAVLFATTILVIVFTLSIIMRPEAAKLNETKYDGAAKKTQEKQLPASSEKKPAVIACEQGNVTLKEYEGKVGIYSFDGILIRTIDVPVDRLPDPEQKELLTGMVISEEDLPFAIESFES